MLAPLKCFSLAALAAFDNLSFPANAPQVCDTVVRGLMKAADHHTLWLTGYQISCCNKCETAPQYYSWMPGLRSVRPPVRAQKRRPHKSSAICFRTGSSARMYLDSSLGQLAELAINESDLNPATSLHEGQNGTAGTWEAHKKLCHLSWYGLATTNYDRLIEKAYEQMCGCTPECATVNRKWGPYRGQSTRSTKCSAVKATWLRHTNYQPRMSAYSDHGSVCGISPGHAPPVDA